MNKSLSRKLAFLLVFLLAGSVLTSCQTGQTTPVQTSGNGNWPVTVKNAAGEDVVIKAEPQAIVATNVWAGEMLLDLVEADRIIALSAWGDDPALSDTAGKAAAVATRVNTQDPEGIVAVRPDLVILDTFSDADGSLTRTLTDAKIVVLQLASPTDFDQIKAAIATLAAAVGAVDKGAELIAGVDTVLDSVGKKLAGLTEDQKMKVIYYEDYYDQSGSSAGMLAAYGAGSPFDAIAIAAGTVNVCNVQNYSAVSKEKVVGEWKPDILIVPAITYGPDFKAVDDGGETVIAAIKADQIMQTLPAVQNDKVFALTEKYRGSTSHYMVKAVEELAKLAYPDLIP
jgi:iron complex transport system substrate-binding protein